MTKTKTFKTIPASPQLNALAHRDSSRRIIANLTECLVDHIIIYHTTEESALAAMDFSLDAIRNELRTRFKRVHGKWEEPKT